MKLAQVVPSLEVRHGGPSRSVLALANSLAVSGESVDLLTTTTARPPRLEGDPVDHGGATIHAFRRVFPRRLCRSPGLSEKLSRERYECIHHHSLWLLTLRYAAKAARRDRIPLVISPRGMLSGWAYRHHRWRKLAASWLVHPRALHRAAGWHATSESEAYDIRQLGFTQPICVAPNAVVTPTAQALTEARAAWWTLVPAARSRPVALFYSRFHRKKRLRELIELWCSAPRGDWLLLIAGVPEEQTVEGLRALVASAGASAHVVVHDGGGLPPPYAVASLFLLPSHSENFGLVIAEALAAGVPALVTDTTPWSGLAREGCGACVPWADYPAALAAALTTSATDLAAQGKRGRAWIEREFSWARSAAQLKAFYPTLTAR